MVTRSEFSAFAAPGCFGRAGCYGFSVGFSSNHMFLVAELVLRFSQRRQDICELFPSPLLPYSKTTDKKRPAIRLGKTRASRCGPVGVSLCGFVQQTENRNRVSETNQIDQITSSVRRISALVTRRTCKKKTASGCTRTTVISRSSSGGSKEGEENDTLYPVSTNILSLQEQNQRAALIPVASASPSFVCRAQYNCFYVKFHSCK